VKINKRCDQLAATNQPAVFFFFTKFFNDFSWITIEKIYYFIFKWRQFA